MRAHSAELVRGMGLPPSRPPHPPIPMCSQRSAASVLLRVWSWPIASVGAVHRHVRSRGQTGSHRLRGGPTRLTLMYGPAVRCKWILPSWQYAVSHQCIRSQIGAVLLRTIMDISARAISLTDRPQRAIWVTSVRMRREDRTSISSHPLADLGTKLLIGLRHRFLLISRSSFFRAKGRSFVPPRRPSLPPSPS